MRFLPLTRPCPAARRPSLPTASVLPARQDLRRGAMPPVLAVMARALRGGRGRRPRWTWSRSPWGRAASPASARGGAWRRASASRPACPVIGVTVGEALAELAAQPGRAAAVVRDRQPARPGLPGARTAGLSLCRSTALPDPDGPVAVAGDAAAEVAAPARGAGRRRDADRRATADAPAYRAWRRSAGWRARCRRWPPHRSISTRPEARLPAAGLRPAPRRDDRPGERGTRSGAGRDPCRGVSAARGLGRGGDFSAARAARRTRR